MAEVSSKTKAADSLPYLDLDNLLKECLQIVDQHFRWLRGIARFTVCHTAKLL